ncbi:MAG: glycosyltransferase family 4 protein [Tatlockia sp.]|nr:glycosyltransferase family 4 protein [Tatlockia sp.]
MIDSLKKIAVDLTPILPGGENGGAKIFVLELLCQLAKLTPGTEFILLTQAASHAELKAMECPNIKCVMVLGHSVKKTSLFGILSSILGKTPFVGRRFGALAYRINTLFKRRQAYSLLRNIKANLLFCPFTAPTYYEAGIPTVCTIYDLQYKTYPEFFKTEELIHRNQTFIEACRRATMLTAISEYSRQSVLKHSEIQPEKIRTIHLQMAHRIRSDSDIEQDKSILSRLGLTPQQYLLYPANFWKHKNHEMLLTAFGIACRGNLPATIKLVCTGAEGPRQDWLKEAAAMMKLGERVLFPGFLSDAELGVLLTNSMAVIYPSLYEGFGLPVIEAMAAGIPVACSNLTSLPEIAGDAALVFNPRIPTQLAKVMVTLTTDKEVRLSLITAGKKRAQLFSDSSRMAQEYWSLFQQALAEEIPLTIQRAGGKQHNDESIELISGKNLHEN